MNQHALIAPSSLARTVKCTAWLGLAAKMPPAVRAIMEAEGDEAKEGNAADWVAKQYARGNEVAYGTETPVPGFKVDYDMIHGAELWASALGYGFNSGVPVFIERIHPQHCWGEPDGWRYDPIAGVLRVPDYKYGFRLVDDFENWQLMAYAVGLLDTLRLNDQETTVKLIVVQPRAFHPRGPVREWSIKGDELRAYANIAAAAALAALSPILTPELVDKYEGHTPKAVTGEHCYDCPARLNCAAFIEVSQHDIALSRKPVPVAMTPQQMGVQLALVQAAAARLKSMEDALTTQADALIRQGQVVTNYILEPGQARLEWLPHVTADAVIALGLAYGKDFKRLPGDMNHKFNSPTVTPTQAKKALGKVDGAVIDSYSSRPTGALQLTRIDTSETRRAFAGNVSQSDT